MPARRSPLPDVFGYLDFRKFLRDWFEAKKENNARFSHRLFARWAGLKSPSALLNVIEGRRNMSGTLAGAAATAMELDAEEKVFFLALVQLQCAEQPEIRDRAMEYVRATRRFREARLLDRQALEFLALWYLPALHELSACEGFVADPTWIARELRPNITVAQATEGLATLVDLGLLRPTEDGRLVRADASVVTPREVAGLAARQYHRGMLSRAAEALDYPAAERHLCGVTVAIPREQVARLKQELDRFQERVLDLCDGAVGPRHLVVQVNLQLVPLTADTGRAE